MTVGCAPERRPAAAIGVRRPRVSRRAALQVMGLVGLALGGGSGLAACGRPGGAGVDVAISERGRVAPSVAALPDGVAAVTRFGERLFGRLASGRGNIVCSPYSVALALAMARNGARGRTAAEMDVVLGASGVEQLNAGLNALGQLLGSRSGDKERADRTTATVTLDVANAVWGQKDTPWEKAFLDALAGSYGAGVNLVDFPADAAGARSAVNRWTSDRTHGRMSEIVPDGAFTPLTRMALVNAIYLKAPWEAPFTRALTTSGPFTTAAGSTVQADMMRTSLDRADAAAGDGWQAGRLRYAGNELAMALVLPDEGRFDWVQSWLSEGGVTQLLSTLAPVSRVEVTMPRFSFRLQAPLTDVLSAMGMPSAFDEATADFTGMTTRERLLIGAVLHEAFVAVDEEGTEAAAATAVVMRTTSAPQARPVTLTLDRPFLFVIHDVQTAAPLFVGRVSDPKA